jgi:hypothetical protein
MAESLDDRDKNRQLLSMHDWRQCEADD